MTISNTTGLYTFTPTHGPYKSQVYYLPPVVGQDVRTFHLIDSANQPIEGQNGVYLPSGTAPEFDSGGSITASFYFLHTWCLTNPNIHAPYNNTDVALGDFVSFIIRGGLGTLVDRFYDNTGTAQIRETNAIISGDVTITRQVGGIITIDTTFTIPTGMWYVPSTGQQIGFH